MNYSICVCFFLLSACSASRTAHTPSFERQSFEKTVDGCRRPGRVILGLDLDYDMSLLPSGKDSIRGRLTYFGERYSPDNSKINISPYARILYIYTIDTANCNHRYLGKSGEHGEFAVPYNRPGGVIGFSYYKLDDDNFNVVDAIIFRR